MLAVAYMFKEELNKKICEMAYNKKYMYYNFSSYWSYDYRLDDNSYNSIVMVSLDKDKNIIGYFYAEVNRDVNKVSSLGIVNFGELNYTFSRDLGKFLTSLFEELNFNKIEFSVVIGNPVEDTYDKIMEKYGGRIIGVRKESTRLYDGKLYDVKMYEIFKRDYDKRNTIGMRI